LIILCAFKMKASRSKSPRKSIISEKMLDDFILRFGEKIPKSKPAKVNRAKKRQTRKERYKPLKSDVIARQKGIPKKGSCTARWEKMYPNARTNAQKAKITGIPKDILDKVDNKGRGAYYSSGSRPGQTAISWGIARVNCFALNKKTVTDGPDRNLYQDAIRRSPKAKQWFSKTKF
jgi:hypothetical protein